MVGCDEIDVGGRSCSLPACHHTLQDSKEPAAVCSSCAVVDASFGTRKASSRSSSPFLSVAPIRVRVDVDTRVSTLDTQRWDWAEDCDLVVLSPRSHRMQIENLIIPSGFWTQG